MSKNKKLVIVNKSDMLTSRSMVEPHIDLILLHEGTHSCTDASANTATRSLKPKLPSFRRSAFHPKFYDFSGSNLQSYNNSVAIRSTDRDSGHIFVRPAWKA